MHHAMSSCGLTLAVAIFVQSGIPGDSSTQEARKPTDQEFAVDRNANSADRAFEGRIVDENGNAIAGAEIEWGPIIAEYEGRERTISDEEGRYRLIVNRVSPQYRLGVSAKGYAPQFIDNAIPRRVDSPSVCEFTLQPGNTLSGIVVDTEGTPCPGVRVTASLPPWGFDSSFSRSMPASFMPGSRCRGVTDSNGRFELDSLPPGGVILDVKTDELLLLKTQIRSEESWSDFRDTIFRTNAEYRFQLSEPLPSEPSIAVEEPQGTIRLRVVDALSSHVIPEITITRRMRTSSWHPRFVDNRHLLSEGIVAGREYLLTVFAPGYEPETIRTVADVAELENFVDEVALTPGKERLMQLVDAETGSALRDVEVLFVFAGRTNYLHWFYYARFDDSLDGLRNCLRITTDMAGQFSISDGHERRGTLILRCTGYERLIVEPSRLDALEENTPKGMPIQIRVEPQSTVTLQLEHDGDLIPLGSGSISRVQTTQFSEHFETADPDGEGLCHWEGLSAGTYTLSGTGGTESDRLPRFHRTIHLPAGENQIVTIGGDLGDHSLAGRATPFANMKLVPQFDWEYSLLESYADADGNYLFEGLVDGEYELNYRAASFGSSLIMLEDSAEIAVDGDTIFHFAQPH